jgi:DNA-binding transcriptional MerR regulator
LYTLPGARTVEDVAMRIGELARRTGVEAGTLRAWERRFGLLTPTRTPGGQRQYSEEDVARVLTVRRLIDEGLTLASAAARVVSAGDGGPPNEPESRVLQQILQNLTLGVLVGKDARTIYANRRMAEMLRSTVEELLATNLLSFPKKTCRRPGNTWPVSGMGLPSCSTEGSVEPTARRSTRNPTCGPSSTAPVDTREASPSSATSPSAKRPRPSTDFVLRSSMPLVKQ